MNILRFGISIIALLTVTKTYAMESDDSCSDPRIVTKIPSPQRAERDEGNDHYLLHEMNAYMLRRGKSYFHKFNDSSYAECIISVSEKVLKDPSNTAEEIANIHIHRGAAWHQLGYYFEALKDFQTALSFMNSNGYSVLLQKVYAQVESHIGIIIEEVGRYDEAASIYEVVLARKIPTGFALSASDRSDIGSRLEKIRVRKCLAKMRIDYILNETEKSI